MPTDLDPPQPSGSSASSGSVQRKDLRMFGNPYWVCPCKAAGKKIRVTAIATGPGAAEAEVRITGPNGAVASNKGSATLEYTTQESDRGSILTFNATATDRQDRSWKGYVLKSVFINLIIADGASKLVVDDGPPPNIYNLTVVNDPRDAGIFYSAAFGVIPYVPDEQDPTQPGLRECPFDFQLKGMIMGIQASATEQNPLPNPLHVLPVDDRPIPTFGNPLWDSDAQVLTADFLDLIGLQWGTPTLLNVTSAVISARANEYLRTKCSDCTSFETIGKGTWQWSAIMTVNPFHMPVEFDVFGTFDGTDGSASSEDPIFPW